MPLPDATSSQLYQGPNDLSLRVNLSIQNDNNSNQEVGHSDTGEEPPPDYFEATAIANSTFRSTEPPPLYEDVIKKEQIVLFYGTNNFT